MAHPLGESKQGALRAGELIPIVGLEPLCGSSVINLGRPAEQVVTFYNQRGTAER